MADAKERGSESAEVLVVGAGPVGLTLAIALRRLSVGVRVVDKAPETKRQPRACVIWPRAEEALAQLGVVDPLVDLANGFGGAEVYANARRLGELEMGDVPSAYPRPLVVEQHDTERLLAEQLERMGVRVEWGAEVADVRVFGDRAEADLKRADGSRETASAGWVVGAEGTRSVVRERLGIPFEGGRRKNLQALQVNAVAKNWPYPYQEDRGYFFLAPGVSIGVFPLPVGGYRFFAFADDPDPSRKDPPTLGEMRELVARTAGAPGLVLEPTEPSWLNRARFADRVAATLRRGRALLVGDAAHAWAPIGGHGMNAGIRGAHNLAWKLAAVVRGEAREELLDTYSGEQRAAARAVMDEMRFNALEIPLPPLGLRAFAAAAPFALSSGAFKRRLEFALSDLGMHHRKSPLSVDRAPGEGSLRKKRRLVRAGDRAPDVAVSVDGSGRAFLHELLSYERWTLFLAHGAGDDGASRRAREERAHQAAAPYAARVGVASVAPHGAEAQRALGNGGLAVLVRPDGHVGLVAPVDDAGALGAYLGRWYRAAPGTSRRRPEALARAATARRRATAWPRCS
jgi:2-polyprenyl-6-methoxyphenol hydroxylase-like FAD-dependent oxidoreductase